MDLLSYYCHSFNRDPASWSGGGLKVTVAVATGKRGNAGKSLRRVESERKETEEWKESDGSSVVQTPQICSHSGLVC